MSFLKAWGIIVDISQIGIDCISSSRLPIIQNRMLIGPLIWRTNFFDFVLM